MVGHVRASLAGAMVAHLRAIKAANLAAEEQLTPGGCWKGIKLHLGLGQAARWIMGFCSASFACISTQWLQPPFTCTSLR